ncbi:unnamed protein product, partial [Larinioides sclopetarius]
MIAGSKSYFSVFFCVLCCICIISVSIDATMPNCDGMMDRCRCHNDYVYYNDDAGPNTSKICLKTFLNTANWSQAHESCISEFSYILTMDINSSMVEDLPERGIDFIW